MSELKRQYMEAVAFAMKHGATSDDLPCLDCEGTGDKLNGIACPCCDGRGFHEPQWDAPTEGPCYHERQTMSDDKPTRTYPVSLTAELVLEALA
ncbi:MAG: hypothetical protein FWD63_05630 [Propionibacteriaceae bacterium]|nr:hypothetical protein [Propionibacteriaceae bacterium]